MKKESLALLSGRRWPKYVWTGFGWATGAKGNANNDTDSKFQLEVSKSKCQLQVEHATLGALALDCNPS